MLVGDITRDGYLRRVSARQEFGRSEAPRDPARLSTRDCSSAAACQALPETAISQTISVANLRMITRRNSGIIAYLAGSATGEKRPWALLNCSRTRCNLGPPFWGPENPTKLSPSNSLILADSYRHGFRVRKSFDFWTW
jgi:hypothetical protein